MAAIFQDFVQYPVSAHDNVAFGALSCAGDRAAVETAARRAQRIVVLERGRVVEDGSHDELVRAGGRYAAMYALQASRFAEADDGHG